jgi:hypothetical protein
MTLYRERGPVGVCHLTRVPLAKENSIPDVVSAFITVLPTVPSYQTGSALTVATNFIAVIKRSTVQRNVSMKLSHSKGRTIRTGREEKKQPNVKSVAAGSNIIPLRRRDCTVPTAWKRNRGGIDLLLQAQIIHAGRVEIENWSAKFAIPRSSAPQGKSQEK